MFGEVKRHWPRSGEQTVGDTVLRGGGAMTCARKKGTACLKCQLSPNTHPSSKGTHSSIPSMEDRGRFCSCVHCSVGMCPAACASPRWRGCKGRGLIPISHVTGHPMHSHSSGKHSLYCSERERSPHGHPLDHGTHELYSLSPLRS
jgi:hypothetical protein